MNGHEPPTGGSRWRRRGGVAAADSPPEANATEEAAQGAPPPSGMPAGGPVPYGPPVTSRPPGGGPPAEHNLFEPMTPATGLTGPAYGPDWPDDANLPETTPRRRREWGRREARRQSAPDAPPRRRAGRRMSVVLVVSLALGVVLAGGGAVLLSALGRMDSVQNSLEAYIAGDCPAAVSEYEASRADPWIGDPPPADPRQRQAVEECRQVTNVAGEDADRLTAYARLATDFGDSPIRAALRNQVAGAVRNSGALAEEADSSLCAAVLSLRAESLLPRTEATLPELLIKCGDLLGAQDNPELQSNALDLYGDVRKNFAKAPEAPRAIAAEAKLRVDRASVYGLKYNGYEPKRTGEAKGIVLAFRNDAPATLYVSLSGPKESYVLEIPPCTSCEPAKTPKYACQTTTPTTEVKVPAGTYRVAWENIRPGAQYTPAGAIWKLTKPGRYEDCNFLVVRNQAPPGPAA